MNIPKGFKIVQVEPTDEMQMAGGQGQDFCSTCGYDNGGGDPANTYTAMLAAAPTPPQPIYDEAKELDLFIEFASDKSWFNPGFKDRDDTKMQFQEEFTDAIWIGWLACAQSRAKAGEVGHD